jgi:integrase
VQRDRSAVPAGVVLEDVAAFATENGFTGITLHTLRHGAATLVLAAGVADTVAMRTMGHADTRILARYQDVVSELQRDATARMDSLLGGSAEGL